MRDIQAIENLIERILVEGALPVEAWPERGALSPQDLGLRSDGRHLSWQEPLDLMCAEAIQSQLPELHTKYFSFIDSTNTQLMVKGETESIASTLYVAEFQYGGRGRRGRSWLSPYGRNLSMSLALGTRRHLGDLGGLSLVVGLALADALQTLGLRDVQLKWPNDILVDGAKLCGILIELLQKRQRVEYVVGMGVNVNLTDLEIARIDRQVTDLRRCAIAAPRTELVVRLIRNVHAYLLHFEAEGFAPFVSAFNDLHLYHGQTCSIIQGDQTTTGIVTGIGEQGELILDTGQGERKFHGGEVSLRPG